MTTPQQISEKTCRWLQRHRGENWNEEIKKDLMIIYPSIEIQLMEKIQYEVKSLISHLMQISSEYKLEDSCEQIIKYLVFQVLEKNGFDQMEQKFYLTNLDLENSEEHLLDFWIQWVELAKALAKMFDQVEYQGQDENIKSLWTSALENLKNLRKRLDTFYAIHQ